ncbi:hypothetical protein HOD41_07340 [bacterium]|jgi:hypothetical protein|nr:hypothetical protein [bacterium]
MIAKQRIYLDKTGKKVLPYGHADCATLLAGIGDQIPEPFDSQCKDGKAPGKEVVNAPKDLPAITPAKLKAQGEAATKHRNTKEAKEQDESERKEKATKDENKEAGADENKGSGVQINAKKDKE